MHAGTLERWPTQRSGQPALEPKRTKCGLAGVDLRRVPRGRLMVLNDEFWCPK